MPKDRDKTRAELLGEDAQQRNMPELSCGDSLIKFLFEIGPTLAGALPLTFQEIDSWSRLTQTELTPWEALTIKELSLAYAAQLSKKDLGENAPFYTDNRTVEQQRADVSSKFKTMAKRSRS